MDEVPTQTEYSGMEEDFTVPMDSVPFGVLSRTDYPSLPREVTPKRTLRLLQERTEVNLARVLDPITPE